MDVSPEHPVVITNFIEGAKEIELRCCGLKGRRLVNWAISEHVENAGVHSGDATMVLPAITLSPETQERVRQVSERITHALEVSGPVNLQYLWKDNELKVIECNLRASRSFPFVSKVLGIDFVKTAAKVFAGEDPPTDHNCMDHVPHYGVKAPQFSFQRLLKADPRLGVEMASTGEVACFGRSPHEAFLKALLATPPFRWPHKKRVLLSNVGKGFTGSAKSLQDQGFSIFATEETSKILDSAGIKSTPLSHARDAENSVFDVIEDQGVDLVINFPGPEDKDEDFYSIRRRAVDFAIPLINNQQVGKFFVESVAVVKEESNLVPDAHEDYFDKGHLAERWADY